MLFENRSSSIILNRLKIDKVPSRVVFICVNVIGILSFPTFQLFNLQDQFEVKIEVLKVSVQVFSFKKNSRLQCIYIYSYTSFTIYKVEFRPFL